MSEKCEEMEGNIRRGQERKLLIRACFNEPSGLRPPRGSSRFRILRRRWEGLGDLGKAGD